MTSIYNIAKKCSDYIEQTISFKRNKIHYGSVILTDYDVIGNIKELECLLKNLYTAIKNRYPSIAAGLKENMDLYDNDRIVHILQLKQ